MMLSVVNIKKGAAVNKKDFARYNASQLIKELILMTTRLRSSTDYLAMFALANVLGCCARWLGSLGSSLMPLLLPQSSQNNKNQQTHAAPAKISYHQARGSHVQRSKYPGGSIRSLL
jgi:hypothetical protein